MLRLLVYWILSAVVLLVMARVLPGIRIASFGMALVAVIVIGFLNATLGAILKFFGAPLNFITLGLFALVINAIVLKVAAGLMPGFSIRGFLPAFLTAIALALLHVLIR